MSRRPASDLGSPNKNSPVSERHGSVDLEGPSVAGDVTPTKLGDFAESQGTPSGQKDRHAVRLGHASGDGFQLRHRGGLDGSLTLVCPALLRVAGLIASSSSSTALLKMVRRSP